MLYYTMKNEKNGIRKQTKTCTMDIWSQPDMNITCHFSLIQAWLKNCECSLGDHDRHTLTIQIWSFGIATSFQWSTIKIQDSLTIPISHSPIINQHQLAITVRIHQTGGFQCDFCENTLALKMWNPNIHSSWPSNFPQAIFWFPILYESIHPIHEQSQYPAAAWATLVPWTNCRWTRWCWTIWLLIEGPLMGWPWWPWWPSPAPIDGWLKRVKKPRNNGIKHDKT